MRTLTFRTKALALVLVAAGCGADPLEVDLDVITPESAASAVGAQALRAAALRDMWVFTGYNVYAWAAAGLLSDEIINARNGFEHVDQRNIAIASAPNTTVWTGFSGVLYSGPRAIDGLTKYVAESPTRNEQIGEVRAIRGLALTIGGEIFCNGIPRSYLLEDGSKVYDTKSYSNVDLWTEAVAQFDSALAVMPTTSTVRYLARVGKARALLDLNRANEAAAVVKAGGDGAGSVAVPSTYKYEANYSATTITNGPYDWMPSSANFGTPNGSETATTMDWRDPRIGVKFFRTGQDGVTPVYIPGSLPWAQATGSPFPIATGQEARLIEAEVALRNNDPSWLTTLNALRAASTFAAQLPPLSDPGTQAAREDMVFKERAMWMYLTVHRLGDLRRLVRQYGRPVNAVFPSGAYFKGGVYGNDVALKPSQTEADTHPHWDACTDNNP